MSVPMARGNGHQSNPLPTIGARSFSQTSSTLSLYEFQDCSLNSPPTVKDRDSDTNLINESAEDEMRNNDSELIYRKLSPSIAPCLEAAFLRKSQETMYSQEYIDECTSLETGQGSLQSYWSDDSDDKRQTTSKQSSPIEGNNLFSRKHKGSVGSTNAPSNRLRDSFRSLRRGKSQSCLRESISSPSSIPTIESDSITTNSSSIKKKSKKRPPLPRLPAHEPITPTASYFPIFKQPV